MASLIKCGKCIGCTRFNGRNGSGYQPCHRPITPRPPEFVQPPPLVYLYGDETSGDSGHEDKPSWYIVWLFGLFLGISIGLLIAKSL